MSDKEKTKLIVSILATLPMLVMGINIIVNSHPSTVASIAKVRN